METLTLGPSDLKVSRFGFGCWQLGGHGWQAVDQKSVVAAVHHAVARGVNFFDTADVYGLGESERLLGAALATSRGTVIATKGGVRVTGEGTVYDNSRTWLQQALEASLKRLGRDCIDLYQLHRHDGKRPLEDIFSDFETWRAQGKIRWYGISNVDPRALPKTLPPGLVSATLKYNLVEREWQNAIPKNLGFIAWGALAQGLLSGKYHRESTFAESDIRSRGDSIFAEQYWDRYETLLAALKNVAAQHHHTMAQTSLRWVLDTVPNSVVLAGIKNTQQLDDNLGAMGWHLSADACAELAHA